MATTQIPDTHWIEQRKTVVYTYWWTGPLGTYLAETPRGHADKMVGHRETVTVDGIALGDYRELGDVRYSTDEPPRTYVHTTEDLPDVFYKEPRIV